METDEGNYQGYDGDAAEKGDQQIFRQILRHEVGAVGKCRTRLKLQIVHQENGARPIEAPSSLALSRTRPAILLAFACAKIR
jgi:hypothetical protein